MKMQTALFTYRRRVQAGGEESFNDNFINPLNVTSFYWQQNDEGKMVLNVYLNAVRASRDGGTNAYSITFGESIGTKFCNHMEEFLRFLIAAPLTRATTPHGDNNKRDRHARRAVDADIVEDLDTPGQPEAEWK